MAGSRSGYVGKYSMLIGNEHINTPPSFCAGMPGVPIVVCGDLNSLPDSAVVEFLTNGRIPADHEHFQGHGYEGFLTRFSASVRPGMRSVSAKPELVHHFSLKRVYSGQMHSTNYTYDFKGVIDYVFYSSDFLSPLGLLGPVSLEWLKQYKITGCPNAHYPSDHFPLLCEFEMLAQHWPSISFWFVYVIVSTYSFPPWYLLGIDVYICINGFMQLLLAK